MAIRVIPCLLLRNGGLVKTRQFSDPKYVGDPLNAVRIFNEKCVDELMFLDITATAEGRGPQYEVIRDIASECFMPFAYGGGISSLDEIGRILGLGVEKVVLNTAAVEKPDLIRQAADVFGSQAIVVSIDARRKFFGRYEVFVHGKKKAAQLNPIDLARRVADLGAGEILLTSVDREGTGSGYDLELIGLVSDAVQIPVVANGGASGTSDFSKAAGAGAAAVAAGSCFVFYGKHRAVLITYPTQADLKAAFEAG